MELGNGVPALQILVSRLGEALECLGSAITRAGPLFTWSYAPQCHQCTPAQILSLAAQGSSFHYNLEIGTFPQASPSFLSLVVLVPSLYFFNLPPFFIAYLPPPST
jgi:hypothetical protein